MAHELEFNAQAKRFNMFSVLETPWHAEGVILNAAPSLPEGMALAGHDYDLALRDLYVREGEASAFERTGYGRAVVRTDTNRVLGIVSDRYRPVTNGEAFGVLEPLLDSGVAHLETGGTLRGGRDAWMLVRFDVKDPVVQEVFADEVIPFGLIANNHGGDSGVVFMETPVRVVCANTLGAAMVNWRNRSSVVSVPHLGDARVRVVEAAEKLFGGIVDRYRGIAEGYATLKATRLSVDAFVRSVLDVAAPLPKDPGSFEAEHLTARGYDLALAGAERRREALREAWTSGKGHSGNHSAWEAYNGAVEVIDHNSALYRTNGSRVASLMSGRLLERKAAVLNAVMAECLVESK
jgi:phage/plasmid-like protein (TIGR03299 family)